MDQTRYYVASDTRLLLDMFTTEIAFLKSNWKMLGRPIILIDFKQSILGKPFSFDCKFKEDYLHVHED